MVWKQNEFITSRDSLNLNAQVYGNSRNPGACCTIVKSNKPQATSLSLFAWYTRCDYFIITHRTIICDVSYKLLTEKNRVFRRSKITREKRTDTFSHRDTKTHLKRGHRATDSFPISSGFVSA